METGVSPLYYPQQTAPLFNLEPDNSYYRVNLHDAQAFFAAGWLARTGFLIVSSSVESSFQPGSPTQSLHQIAVLQKNVPCHPGISTNLTEWLPARRADSIRVDLKFNVVQDTPFTNLVGQLERLGLVAKVAPLGPQWAVAVKITQIVGRVMSYLVGEGQNHELFTLTMDLNVATLRTGYYAVVGSQTPEPWPDSLQINVNGNVTDSVGLPLHRLSYVVLQVLSIPRRGEESAQGEGWWELLQAGKEQALASYPNTDQERHNVLANWRSTLSQVRALARKEHGYLRKEIDELVQKTQVELETVILPTTTESHGDVELPAEWQKVLGVRTERELRQSVRDYSDALEASQRLLGHYHLAEE